MADNNIYKNLIEKMIKQKSYITDLLILKDNKLEEWILCLSRGLLVNVNQLSNMQNIDVKLLDYNSNKSFVTFKYNYLIA
ncbi:MAG: hypothetical protein K6F77_07145 [Lachnospiraceae bacterium]|nr:hypothetical protein [Lachnospiraceae bacterium]